jgi:hypothetical protein
MGGAFSLAAASATLVINNALPPTLWCALSLDDGTTDSQVTPLSFLFMVLFRLRRERSKQKTLLLLHYTSAQMQQAFLLKCFAQLRFGVFAFVVDTFHFGMHGEPDRLLRWKWADGLWVQGGQERAQGTRRAKTAEFVRTSLV